MNTNPGANENTAPPRYSMKCDVSDVMEEDGKWYVWVDIVLPPSFEEQTELLLFCCVPGGGCTGQYFDLRTGASDDYSFANAGISYGYGCITVDNLGTGRSTSTGDLWLTPTTLAAANTRAFDLAIGDIAERFPALKISTVGIGHSMGAMLTILSQAHDPRHSAIVSLGFTTRGLPHLLTRRELNSISDGRVGLDALRVLARARFTEESRTHSDRNADRTPFEFVLPTPAPTP